MQNQDINTIIGQNLLKLRRNKKLTQLELAEKFNYSDKSISKWEKGESLPSVDVLYQLAKFYGVTLDALTSEEDIDLTAAEQKQISNNHNFPTKLIISLLAVSAVWIAATIWFITYKLTTGGTPYMLFLWSVPISCVLLIIFNSIWGKREWLFWIISVLLWTILACVHIQLIEYNNFWIIYFIGIPLQIAVILWGALMKGPHKKQAKVKQNKENIDKEKSLKPTKTKKQKNLDVKQKDTLQTETSNDSTLKVENENVLHSENILHKNL